MTSNTPLDASLNAQESPTIEDNVEKVDNPIILRNSAILTLNQEERIESLVNPILKKLCRNCNEEFIPGRKDKTFCSNSCAGKFYHNKDRDRKGEILLHIKCLNCNKYFDTYNKKKIYCSKECCNLKFKDMRMLDTESLYSLRFKVFKRDNFTCKYCGRNVIDDNIKTQVEHIIPRIKGGTNNEDNLVTSCEECNLGKGDVLLEEHQVKKLKEYIENAKDK